MSDADNHSKPEAEPQSEHLNIKVTDGNNEVFFKIKRTTQLKKLMDAFCDRQGKSPASVRFLFDGTRVSGTDSPDTVSNSTFPHFVVPFTVASIWYCNYSVERKLGLRGLSCVVDVAVDWLDPFCLPHRQTSHRRYLYDYRIVLTLYSSWTCRTATPLKSTRNRSVVALGSRASTAIHIFSFRDCGGKFTRLIWGTFYTTSMAYCTTELRGSGIGAFLFILFSKGVVYKFCRFLLRYFIIESLWGLLLAWGYCLWHWYAFFPLYLGSNFF